MKRLYFCVAVLGLLAGCAPSIPDSGVSATGGSSGFENYDDLSNYRTEREADLLGTDTPQTTGGSLPTGTETAESDPVTAAAIALNNPGISDEQDFDAVAERETIESDAERLRQQRAAYTQVQPTAVPNRPNSGPNIVAYALSTSHPVGTKLHSRNPFTGEARFQQACARYPSPDLAQEAFLQAGGPERDRLRIDPDGDGYACAWNPVPFRRVAGLSGN